MPKKEFTLTKEQQLGFASIFVLDKILRKNRRFSILATDSDAMCVKEPLDLLFKQDLIEIEGEFYVATEKGQERIRAFRQRYEEFLSVFDIYCAVDLGKGEFAFSSYYDFADDEVWKQWLKQERWEDLRVAVAMFKGIDPVEIVFMSFIAEERFEQNPDGKWEIGLVTGANWDEILKIVNSNIHPEETAYEYEDTDASGQKRLIQVTSEDAMLDIIKRGTEIMFDLIKKGKELETAMTTVEDGNGTAADTVVEETVVETTNHNYDYAVADPIVYYHPYWDPWYVSPFWFTPPYPVWII